MKKYFKPIFIIINLIIAAILSYYTVYYSDVYICQDMMNKPDWYLLIDSFVFWILGEMIVYSGLALAFAMIVFIASIYKH